MRTSRTLHVCVAICAFILAWAGQASGRIIYVDPNGGADFTSIQTAIDDADNGDEIEVGPGTYYESIDFKGKAIRLYSSSGPEVTTIDGSQTLFENFNDGDYAG